MKPRRRKRQAKKQSYRIEFSPEADDQLAALNARDRATILDSVHEQLRHQPRTETRHRGPLRPNPVAQFRLRVAGNWRVYYDVAESPKALVLVKSVGYKDRDRVYVGGKEIDL